MLSSVFLYRQCHFITKNVLIITNLLMKEILYSKIKARKAFLKNNKGEISMKKLMLILIEEHILLVLKQQKFMRIQERK